MVMEEFRLNYIPHCSHLFTTKPDDVPDVKYLYTSDIIFRFRLFCDSLNELLDFENPVTVPVVVRGGRVLALCALPFSRSSSGRVILSVPGWQGLLEALDIMQDGKGGKVRSGLKKGGRDGSELSSPNDGVGQGATT